MTSFKPGQRVRLKEAMGNLKAGEIVTIDTVTGSSWALCRDAEGALYSLLKEHLEAVGDQTPAPLPTEQPANDPVHRPHHYARFAIEPVEFVMKNGLPFAIGNVIKYCCRWDAKDGIQDLKKARRYLDMEIKRLEGDENFAK